MDEIQKELMQRLIADPENWLSGAVDPPALKGSKVLHRFAPKQLEMLPKYFNETFRYRPWQPYGPDDLLNSRTNPTLGIMAFLGDKIGDGFRPAASGMFGDIASTINRYFDVIKAGKMPKRLNARETAEDLARAQRKQGKLPF